MSWRIEPGVIIYDFADLWKYSLFCSLVYLKLNILIFFWCMLAWVYLSLLFTLDLSNFFFKLDFLKTTYNYYYYFINLLWQSMHCDWCTLTIWYKVFINIVGLIPTMFVTVFLFVKFFSVFISLFFCLLVLIEHFIWLYFYSSLCLVIIYLFNSFKGCSRICNIHV